jgi:phosphoribosylformylglycinamidine synthase
MVGVLKDVTRHATLGFKREGDRVVVIGPMPPIVNTAGPPQENPLAGSSYLEIVHVESRGKPIRFNLKEEKRCADLVRSMIQSGLVDTAHDISNGGEAVALSEMSLAGDIGFEYEQWEVEYMVKHRSLDRNLFGEEAGRFLVAVPDGRWDDLQEALVGVAYDEVGTTGGDRFRIGDFIDLSLEEMKEVYERDLFV